jgi:hypothetical protein
MADRGVRSGSGTAQHAEVHKFTMAVRGGRQIKYRCSLVKMGRLCRFTHASEGSQAGQTSRGTWPGRESS